MQGEIVHFRRRFIGGFNQEDVAAYIKQISHERNESLDAKTQAEQELNKLREENARMQDTIRAYERLIEKLKKKPEPASEPVSAANTPAPENPPQNVSSNGCSQKQKSVIIIKNFRKPNKGAAPKKEMEQ